MKSFVYSGAALVLLALAGCSPSSNSNTAANTVAATDNAAVANSAIIPQTSATPRPNAPLVSSVWVPGEDDRLHLKPVSRAALDAQKKFGDPTAALAEIVKMAPDYFPPKTRVLDWNDEGKSVSLNLNANFADAKFWSSKGERTTQLAMYALVNSAATSGSVTKPVILQVEKRPVQTLGEIDASDAIEPDRSLEAKPGAKKAP